RYQLLTAVQTFALPISASAISEGGSAPPHSGWVVKNGPIENWPAGSGVFAAHVTGGRYEDLHIKAAGHEGINVASQSNVQRVTEIGRASWRKESREQVR